MQKMYVELNKKIRTVHGNNVNDSPKFNTNIHNLCDKADIIPHKLLSKVKHTDWEVLDYKKIYYDNYDGPESNYLQYEGIDICLTPDNNLLKEGLVSRIDKIVNTIGKENIKYLKEIVQQDIMMQLEVYHNNEFWLNRYFEFIYVETQLYVSEAVMKNIKSGSNKVHKNSIELIINDEQSLVDLFAIPEKQIDKRILDKFISEYPILVLALEYPYDELYNLAIDSGLDLKNLNFELSKNNEFINTDAFVDFLSRNPGTYDLFRILRSND